MASGTAAEGWSGQAQAFAKPSVAHVLESTSERAAELLAPEVAVAGRPTVFLDVAAGPGTLALHVAKRLAAAGVGEARLLVTDFAPGLVEAAQKRFAEAGASGALPPALAAAECRVLDAHELAGIADGSVTHGGCMFSVNLFERRDVALRELRRVMAPGGRAVVGTWREAGAAALAEAFARHVGALAPGAPLPPAIHKVLDACRRPEDLRAELLAAGFAGVTVEPLSLTMATRDTGVFLGMLRTNPAMAPLLAGAPPGTDFEAAWAAFLAPGGAGAVAFMAPDGVTLQLPYTANLALAQA